MRALLARLGHPERAFPSVHVVGTNGKSTATRTIAALLRAAELDVGAYTSPHVAGWHERLDTDSESFERAVARVRGAAEEVGATQFEALTAAALADFAARGVDAAVVEAGLGGRLDATNVLDARVVLLTNVGLEHTDVLGDTRDEADRLASPLPLFSPRGLYWATTRLAMRLGGLVADGVGLGHRTGFDSGSTLDYVYRNRPHGLGALGRMIDKAYLESIGWRGIRQRKVHVEALLRVAMRRLRAAGEPVRILDIAAGHGRYVLDAVAHGAGTPDSILLRDYREINVEAGRRLIAEKRLGTVARFVAGDAFDRDSLAALDPRPTLGIVSGLYELFPDNEMVGRSLAGLAAAIPPGGFLVYTCQPWHPQLELIARVLTSHRQGQAWIMRRRTQAEMDQLVSAAGFRKIEQRIDEWGIFTVALAERVAPPAA